MDFKQYMADTSNGLVPFNQSDLDLIKSKLTKDDLEVLENDVKDIFKEELQTITIYPKQFSKDKHEYESISIYTWPNPDTKDGLPYVTLDGQVNYDNLKNDKEALRKMSYVTYLAALMFYLTEDVKYKDLLNKHLHYFFLNEETKMNPSLAHGQAHPGKNDGQAGGIIDMAISFGYTLSLIDALNDKGLMDQDITNQLKEWFEHLHHWLLTHKNALEMEQRTNNIAMVYDYFLMIISKFLNKTEVLAKLKNSYKTRVESQIDEDGKMELELKRTKTRSYTMMATRLWLCVGKYYGEELFSINKIVKMMEFYLPYGKGDKEWDYKQIQEYYKYYDLMYLFHSHKYFNFDSSATITKKQKDENIFFYTLFKNIFTINVKG